MQNKSPVMLACLVSVLTACSSNNSNVATSATESLDMFDRHTLIQDRANKSAPVSEDYPTMRSEVKLPVQQAIFQQKPSSHIPQSIVRQKRVKPPVRMAAVPRPQPMPYQRHLSQQVHRSVAPPPVVQRRVVQPSRPSTNPVNVNRNELYAIGDKIFQNEAGGVISNLVHWNKREDFASMGIGHFTWYPSNRRIRYGNTFPGLLDYLMKNGVHLPAWVQQARFTGAPWRTRGQLFAAKNDPQVKQLAQILYDTRHLQAQYIMGRAMRAMPKLVKKTPSYLRTKVANNLNAVANTPGGRYVLIDYVNFKGEGLSRKGGYKGQNWGLLQVLEDMNPASVGPTALNEFADAAIRTLERRVRNSDPKRDEKKWLPGWRNRINTYRNPI